MNPNKGYIGILAPTALGKWVKIFLSSLREEEEGKNKVEVFVPVERVHVRRATQVGYPDPFAGMSHVITPV